MNKNQKYTLNIGIEDNTELNQAIDAMIRARVQNIARQEVEALLEQEVISKARSVILDRAKNLSEDTIRYWVGTILRNDPNFRFMLSDAFKEYIISHQDELMNRIDRSAAKAVREKLSDTLPMDIIKTITEALFSKNKSA